MYLRLITQRAIGLRVVSLYAEFRDTSGSTLDSITVHVYGKCFQCFQCFFQLDARRKLAKVPEYSL